MVQILLTLAATILAFALAASLHAVARQGLRRWLQQRVGKQVVLLRTTFDKLRDKDFAGIDKVLFELRDTYNPAVLIGQMQNELAALDSPSGTRSNRLIRSFRALGLTERYLEDLSHNASWRTRAQAAAVLGMLGEMAAVKPLLEAMRDPAEDPDVKLACVEALGNIRDPRIIPELCTELATVNEWSSPRLAQVLAAFGNKAVTHLLSVLDSSVDVNVLLWTAQVLGKIGHAQAVLPLLAQLQARSEHLRVSVCSALGDLGDARAVSSLIQMVLRDPVSSVRAQAAFALGRIGDPRALPLLVACLGDPEYWMRFHALEAIEVLDPDDLTPIETALRDANMAIRQRAAFALDRLGHLDRAFEDLAGLDREKVAVARRRLILAGRAGLSERMVRHLADPNPRVRHHIAWLLGPVGESAHAAVLVKALGDANTSVREAAIKSLGQLAKPGTAAPILRFLGKGTVGAARSRIEVAVVRALKNYSPYEVETLLGNLEVQCRSESHTTRNAAVLIIAVAKGQRVVELLTEMLHDEHIDVRLAVVRALGDRGNQWLVPRLGPFLADASVELRMAAAEALGKIGGQRVIDLLVSRMRYADPEQREVICSALAAMRLDAILPALEQLLASADIGSRLGAIWTLGKTATVGDDRALDRLTCLLDDANSKARASAAGALGKVHCDKSAEALARALTDPDERVRAAVVNALAQMGRPSDVRPLTAALKDPDEFVKSRALLALGRLGGKEAHAAICSVGENNGVDRAVLAVALGLCGIPSAFAQSVRLLKDPAISERIPALLSTETSEVRDRFLGEIRLSEAFRRPEQEVVEPELDVGGLEPQYIKTLRNSQAAPLRAKAAAALATLASDEAREALGHALRRDPDIDVRTEAAKGLGLLCKSAALARTFLFPAALDPAGTVRVVGIRAIGEHGLPADTEPVFEALNASNENVVEAAEVTLAAMFGDNIDELHDRMMGTSSPRFLIAALRVLRRLADIRSLVLLQKLLLSRNVDVRPEACRALSALRVPEAVDSLLSAVDDPIELVRVEALRGLTGIGRSDVVDRVGKLREDPSPRVRVCLVDLLGTMVAPQAIELLEELATDADPRVGAHAALALLALPRAAGMEHFASLWDDLSSASRKRVVANAAQTTDRLRERLLQAQELRVRKMALQILVTLDVKANAPVIAMALQDPKATVRVVAVNALGTLGSKAAHNWLKQARHDPASSVRSAARRLLAKSA